MIFKIWDSFSRDNALFAAKAIINVFWNFFEQSGPEGARGVKKKFQKTLILAIEANSALSHENKTKIGKITHSAVRELMKKDVLNPYYEEYSKFEKLKKNQLLL